MSEVVAGNSGTFRVREAAATPAASFLPADAVRNEKVGKEGGYLIIATKAQLDCYLERIQEQLPSWLRRFVLWLRQPSSRIVRIIVSALLILGGVFSFLPLLGVWMLPLGLIIISQDLPFLQAPLLRAFQWIETTWQRRPWRRLR